MKDLPHEPDYTEGWYRGFSEGLAAAAQYLDTEAVSWDKIGEPCCSVLWAAAKALRDPDFKKEKPCE